MARVGPMASFGRQLIPNSLAFPTSFASPRLRGKREMITRDGSTPNYTHDSGSGLDGRARRQDYLFFSDNSPKWIGLSCLNCLPLVTIGTHNAVWWLSCQIG